MGKRIVRLNILNLYAGIGGNRELWDNCTVIAVENDPAIAAVYKTRFPSDVVIVDDARKYLVNNFMHFDFIWTSPPCQTHSRYRYTIGIKCKGFLPVFPDMGLYGEIIFLQKHFKGLWVVENVQPYYLPLIPCTFKLQRHLFWSNFIVPNKHFTKDGIGNKNRISEFYGHEYIEKSEIKNKIQVLRNCVNPAIGLHIYEAAIKAAKDK